MTPSRQIVNNRHHSSHVLIEGSVSEHQSPIYFSDTLDQVFRKFLALPPSEMKGLGEGTQRLFPRGKGFTSPESRRRPWGIPEGRGEKGGRAMVSCGDTMVRGLDWCSQRWGVQAPSPPRGSWRGCQPQTSREALCPVGRMPCLPKPSTSDVPGVRAARCQVPSAKSRSRPALLIW